ncbi:3-oxoacyl-ACP synthase III family protein [Nocardia niigatensis]
MTLADNRMPSSHPALRRPVGFLGSGLYVPDRVVTNAELAATLDTSDEWITSRTGIRERRFLGDGLATSDMCLSAARQALRRAGLAPEDLDAIIVTTSTPDQPLPSTAVTVKDGLGSRRAIPLDIAQTACAGGIYALLVAAHLLQGEMFERVLVIGADTGSRATDPADRITRVFFGDAAGAVILGLVPDGFGLLSWDFGDQLCFDVAIPAGGSRLPTSPETVEAGEHYVRMNGPSAWKYATENLPASIRETLGRAGLTVGDIDHYLLHQANLNIITHAMTTLGVSMDRAPTTVERFGNTAAASIFTVLHETLMARPETGRLLVLAGIGAGVLWGSMCFRHYADSGHDVKGLIE